MSENKVLSVTRVVRRMRNLLELELGSMWVEGEISNLRRQASGHVYFSLKDEGAQISCVMFRGNAARAKVSIDHGMQVRVFGEISVYEARGSVQLVVREVEAAGVGDLQAKFEALKRKLEAEGLFAQESKKALPRFPMRVGLVTSGSGAALQDMLQVMERRAPWVQAVLYPVQVQGQGAERGIARAIERWGNGEAEGLPQVDVLIVGRGGGSLEDLWNFNEEVVARAIAKCPLPVVSAVGHEIDFTIADFVADMRAPTPSAAAELVVPDRAELIARLARADRTMKRAMRHTLEQYHLKLSAMQRGALSLNVERVLREPMQRLDQLGQGMEYQLQRGLDSATQGFEVLQHRYHRVHPEIILRERLEKLQQRKDRLQQIVQQRLDDEQRELESLKSLLRALGPESAFERGFSITVREDGSLLRSADQARPGESLKTKLIDGEVSSVVE
ncbi:exodeoxyribonuclease VII large subunit [Rubritalea marina]|uniref:exodeoxyribonuclease VII large subunit n=1 Tax=Rubritalea marina TaxID=361055 RepID=UPI0003611E2C|nr:exodeoxyribonuclease VII large subunit [Rubritalea marina]